MGDVAALAGPAPNSTVSAIAAIVLFIGMFRSGADLYGPRGRAIKARPASITVQTDYVPDLRCLTFWKITGAAA